jgi:putative oxidoreductase
MAQSLGLLVLRVGAGGLMLVGHGLDKVVYFSIKAQAFPDPLGLGSPVLSLGLATFAECLCSVLLVLGLATRLAAVPLLITMLVAGLSVHAADPFVKKELAFLYAVPFAALILTGGGDFSLDAALRSRRRRPRVRV